MAQTEQKPSYETSRTKRSLIEGKIHNEDSNDDEEYATAGFYVREKTTDKSLNGKSNKDTDSDKSVESATDAADCKENGVSKSLKTDNPLTNGENSRDADSSSDSANNDENKNDGCQDESQESKEASKSPKNDDVESSDKSKAIEEDNEDDSSKCSDTNLQLKTNSVEEEEKEKQTKEVEEKEEVEEEKEENVKKPEIISTKDKVEVNEKEEHEEISGIKENENVRINDKGVSIAVDNEQDTPNKNEISSVTVDEEKTSVSCDDISQDKSADSEETVKCKTQKNTCEDEARPEKPNDDEKKSLEDSVKTAKNELDTKGPTDVKCVKENEDSNKAENEEPEHKSDNKDSTELTSVEREDFKKVENKEPDNISLDDSVKNVDEESDTKDSSDVLSVKSNEGSKEQENDQQDKKGKRKKNKKIESDVQMEKRKLRTRSSILKDQLEKPKSPAVNEFPGEMDMDEDFDPSLLCPDISMDVDEAPVITQSENENVPSDGNTSPLPYEPVFSELVDEITGATVSIDLTPEEMEMRRKMYGPNNPVQTTKVHCTACNVHLGSALLGANNRFVHPLLKVLICKNCYHFYTSGEFEKDEDGSELYCRWCGQGGQVLCCSSCEFVFCKRCIRNNFGPRKFKEIRDSDDWSCFRCSPGQLSNLRASCAEFMEYYRSELVRAQTLAQTNPEIMTTDYTKCCNNAEKKPEEPKPAATPKPKRKRKESNDDPDYTPILDEDEPPKKKPMPTPTTSTTSSGLGYTVIPPGGLRPVLPKPTPTPPIRPLVQTQNRPQGVPQGQVFKVGNTTFRAKTPTSTPGYTIQRPNVPPGQKNNTPGYIKILPQRPPRPTTSPYTVVSGKAKPTFTTVRPGGPRPTTAAPTGLKHEWFEKTVRAAARVNSNLSYTLTQLNRQQSTASSVEALAMVHNKLQEVLSTSINSLIQIRKNLRTEFIAGIKNIKFPPRPAPIPPTTGPIVIKDDDDVVFVSTPTPTVTLPKNSSPPPLIISPSVTLTKKTPIQKSKTQEPKPSTSINTPNNKTSSSTPSSAPVKGGFLKVRSFSALQNVSSECITIPDDPPSEKLNEKTGELEDPLKIDKDDEKSEEDKTSINDNGRNDQNDQNKKNDRNDENEKKGLNEENDKEGPNDEGDKKGPNDESDKKGLNDESDKKDYKEKSDNNRQKEIVGDQKLEKGEDPDVEVVNVENEKGDKEKTTDCENNDPENNKEEESDNYWSYNTKDQPTEEVRKMMSMVVVAKKSRVVDEIIRAQGMLSCDKKVKEDTVTSEES